jgi:cytochrome c5
MSVVTNSCSMCHADVLLELANAPREGTGNP